MACMSSLDDGTIRCYSLVVCDTLSAHGAHLGVDAHVTRGQLACVKACMSCRRRYVDETTSAADLRSVDDRQNVQQRCLLECGVKHGE